MPLVGTKANAGAFGLGWSASSAEVLGGMVLMTPTSIASTGTGNSSSINANGSVTFSSCATLSLNGVFTSSYDNYMIVIRHTPSAATNVAMRLRASGTDNSTASSYVRQYLGADSSTVSANRLTSNLWDAVFSSFTTQRDGATIYVFGAYLAQPTAMRSVSVQSNSSGAISDNAGTHNQSTAYDGFTLICDTTLTLSGLVTVYGLGG